MDSAGVAELPDGIEMVDFLRWSLTSVDSLPSCHAEDVSQALLVRIVVLVLELHGCVRADRIVHNLTYRSRPGS